MRVLAVVMRTVFWAYALACALSLLLIAANAWGWLGPPEALAAVWALLLSMPWSPLVGWLPAPSMAGALGVIVAGMALNLWLLHRLGAWARRRT